MKIKKAFSLVVAALFTLLTMLSYIPAKEVKAAVVIPKIQFATAPVTQYNVGDRVNFNINAPNYGGRVEYRVVLWQDSKKSYRDLWDASNGHPTRYYTKWQPYGNEIFTLGWIINEPGSYRITVYAKRLGVANNKTYLKSFNCDSYMESVAFKVGGSSTVGSITASTDVIVNQGQVPSLPSTVKAVMTDGTEKSVGVTWGSVNTSQAGSYTIQGTVQGTDKKAVVRVIVKATTAPDTGLSVNSIIAVSTTWVNINLKNIISTIPSASAFSIKSSSNAAVRIVTTSLSTDKKTIQVYTDFMNPGSTYTLAVDGVSYNFVVPYTSGSGSTGSVSISVKDLVVEIGDKVDPNITVYPSSATLRFTSEDDDIAEVNATTGKVTGIEEGTVTIYAYAYSTTYGSAYTTFEVEVVEEYDNLPDEDCCDADHEFDDDVYIITMYIMDSDDDPVENLEEDDFEFDINGETYDFDDDDVLYDFDDYDEEDGIYVFEFDPEELPDDEQERDNEYELDFYINGREVITGYDLTEDGESGGGSTGDVDEDESRAYTVDNKVGTATIYAEISDSRDNPIRNLDEDDFKVKIIDIDTKNTYIVGASGSPFDEFDDDDNEYGEYSFIYEPDTLPSKGYITVDVIVKGVVVKERMKVYVSEVIDDDEDPVPINVKAQFTKDAGEKNYYFYDKTVITINGGEAGDELESLFIKVDDDNPDTGSVDAYLELPGGTKSKWSTFTSTSGLWKLNLPSGKPYKFIEAGTYKLIGTFIDEAYNDVIVTVNIVIAEKVPVPSTYKFVYQVPKEIIEGEEYTVPITLKYDTIGDIGYSNVIIKFAKTSGPNDAHITFKATDSNNKEWTFTDEGDWGPTEGFPIGKDYSVTTNFKLTFSNAGDYVIKFKLFDLKTEPDNVIIESKASVEVDPEPEV